MNVVDPYAPPTAEVRNYGSGSDLELVGKLIRTARPLVLPHDLCVKCGARDERGKTSSKRLVWTSSLISMTMLTGCAMTVLLYWFIILPLLWWVFVLVLYRARRKELDATYHLCTDCNSLRRKKIAGSVAACLATVVLIIYGSFAHSFALAAIGVFGSVIAFVALSVFSRPPIRAKSHNRGTFMVAGASPAFLAAMQQSDSRAVGSPTPPPTAQPGSSSGS